MQLSEHSNEIHKVGNARQWIDQGKLKQEVIVTVNAIGIAEFDTKLNR